MQTLTNLSYAQVDGYNLLLDLYLPDGVDAPVPLIIWVHGGAWWAGSKEDPPGLAIVERGYALASINYRLSQQAKFPAQIHDCKAAVRWLRANAEAYGLDATCFGAWGASAGGHLVALLGAAGTAAELEGDVGISGYSSQVQAVCDWFGPSDFLRMNDSPGQIDHDAPDSPESQLVGAPIQKNVDLAARANPIIYITPNTPPFLIMHGDEDDVVLPNQSQLLHHALETAGISSKLVMLPGFGHGFGRDPSILKHVYTFFDENLKKP